ncbi:MAG: uridine kinase [Crocinitomicaceae bacterium]|nr:MAG: uridine kinase [Crocinitomicaceae bacterium]
MIIGICGGSGSGKTTLLKRISKELKHLEPSIFSMDNYYLPIHKQVKDINGEINFDLPTALDKAKLVQDLHDLMNGLPIEVKEYHFNAPPDKNTLITIQPSKLIIVEGLFLFHYEEVRELIDFSIFMEVDPSTQLDRRLYRDQETRGYSREAILYQWDNHVLPCFQNFLLPYEHDADFRFHNDSRADDEFERLMYDLNMLIAQQEVC